MPGEDMPLMVIVDYSAIDSGLGGPPYPVSVVGVDRTANWAGLDGAAYDAKRNSWREAILGAIDREFPGFAAKVVASCIQHRQHSEHLSQCARRRDLRICTAASVGSDLERTRTIA